MTGTAQREAWLAYTCPPVEQVRPDLWSVPVPIPDSPLRYTRPGIWRSARAGQELCHDLRELPGPFQVG